MPKKPKPTYDIDAFELDHNPAVDAWVKNDHLGFEILYIYRVVVRKYRSDWLIRLNNGDVLFLETEGQSTEHDQVKRKFLAEWMDAVNANSGMWLCSRRAVNDVL